MKYTIKEFANEIRSLYPGHYDDLSDKVLVQLWLKKYPNDSTKIKKVKFIIPITVSIIFIVIIFAFNRNQFKSIDSIFNSKSNIEKISTDLIEGKTRGTWLGQPLRKELADSMFSYLKDSCKLSLDEINAVRLILYNPDPKSLAGKECGTITSYCKWDNQSFIYSNRYKLMPDLGHIFIGISVFQSWYQNEVALSDFKKYLNEYTVNSGVTCEDVQLEFCSKKCEVEYKQNNN